MKIPSYQKINYTLRPAKGAERKMIVEAIGRLRSFSALDSYRYIGFGSPYFSDFSLMHRSLGIHDMICIEQEVKDIKRFEFNRPFSCIELKFGKSTEILPTLEWQERPTIIWLDYDGPINKAIFSDIHLVCSSMTTGSFLLVSIRNNASDFGSDPSERLKRLRSAVGGNKLPFPTQSDVQKVNFGRFLWRIIDAEIQRIVSERSVGLRDDLRFNYKQVLHFDYQDGARMSTIGGVLYQKGQRTLFEQCDFSSLPYNRTDHDACRIKAPLLTFKELRALGEYLPGSIPPLPSMPREEVEAYAEHYRYFPNYIEAVEI